MLCRLDFSWKPWDPDQTAPKSDLGLYRLQYRLPNGLPKSISRREDYVSHARIQKVLSEGSNIDDVFFYYLVC